MCYKYRNRLQVIFNKTCQKYKYYNPWGKQLLTFQRGETCTECNVDKAHKDNTFL